MKAYLTKENVQLENSIWKDVQHCILLRNYTIFNSAENIQECRVSAPQPRAAETEAALTDPQVTWASQVAQW